MGNCRLLLSAISNVFVDKYLVYLPNWKFKSSASALRVQLLQKMLECRISNWYPALCIDIINIKNVL